MAHAEEAAKKGTCCEVGSRGRPQCPAYISCGTDSLRRPRIIWDITGLFPLTLRQSRLTTRHGTELKGWSVAKGQRKVAACGVERGL